MGLAKSIEPIIILLIILMLFPKICTDLGVFIAEKTELAVMLLWKFAVYVNLHLI